MNSTIYLPINLSDNDYVTVIDKDTIRVFHALPEIDSSVSYTDFYINSHYLQKTGTITLDTTYDFINHDNITNNIWYRNDISSIMITFGVMFFVVSGSIIFIAKSFFRGFLR